MSDDYKHIDELEKHLSVLRHPAGNKAEKVSEMLIWFNSLKPPYKADVFLSLVGKINESA